MGEIVWKRTSAHSSAKRYGPVHDVLLFFSRTDLFTWNHLYQDYDPVYIETFFDQIDADGKRWKRSDLTGSGVRHGESGHPWRGIDVTAKGRHWMHPPSVLDELDARGKIHWPKKQDGMPRLKQYPEDLPGVPLQDTWTDIRPMHNLSKERLGYPTQKPEALLERIIQASSNTGDVVLDPFCGCGTAVAVSERLHRRWIGIDITHLAIALMKHRLQDTFGPDLSSYEVIGAPEDLASAEALAQQDRYQFEWWALGLVDARPAQDKKKGADRGVDGHIYFFDDNSGKAKQIIVQVKSGNISAPQVRDLIGVLQREKAAIGLFITLWEPTKAMLKEAAAAGFYTPEYFTNQRFPRVQILTIPELLQGKQAQYPRYAPTATFRQASRRQKGADPQQMLL